MSFWSSRRGRNVAREQQDKSKCRPGAGNEVVYVGVGVGLGGVIGVDSVAGNFGSDVGYVGVGVGLGVTLVSSALLAWLGMMLGTLASALT